MSDQIERWERRLPLSGPAFALLMVAAAIGFPMPPGGDVTASSNPAWLVGHVDTVIAQGYVRALAALGLAALSVAVADACRRALPTNPALPATALCGGVMSSTLLMLSQGVGIAAALDARAGDNPATLRALGSVQEMLLNLTSLPSVLLFGVLGAVALRTGLLPRWLAVVTLLGAPFALVDSASYDGGPFESIGFAGLVFLVAWSLPVGGRLYVHGRSVAAAPAGALGTVLP